MTYNLKNILITGAYGFVGTNLANHLFEQNNQYHLAALDLHNQSKAVYSKYYSWEDYDAIDWDDYHAIIHLAGKAHDTTSSSDPDSYFEINFELTKLVFSSFLKSNANTFIFFSSVKAVTDSVLSDSLLEASIPNPLTPYGQSKLAAEKFILAQEVPASKYVYILRPAMIHGPGNKGNLNLLFSMVQRGIPYPLGAFENQRSFTAMGNMLFIVSNLISKNIESGIYNICDDEPISTLEIVKMIYKSLGKKDKILNIPKSVIKKIAIAGDALKLPLNSERLKKMTESYLVSNRKIKNALSVSALPTDAYTGMLQTINNFKKNNTTT
jgi:nucleoside-diphosphate-sugar epimerase